MAIYQLGELSPSIDPSAYIFDNAVIIGQVILKANVSVWANVSIRADNDEIFVDEGSNIQEGSVLHVDEGTPLHIGKNVTIGHQAMLHGCSIGDGSLIGMQAIVLNHAKIGKNCIIGAGAIIPEDKIVPDHSLVVGICQIVREVTPEDIERVQAGAQLYRKRSELYRQTLKRLD